MFGNKSSKNGFFEALHPKTSFIIGLVLGVLIICTIGFFVLLAGKIDLSPDKPAVTAQGNSNINGQAPEPTQAANQGAANLKKITKDDHIRGDLNAPVIMVEFSDYQCSYCSRVYPTLQQLVDDYNGQVAWVYKHFPLDSIHPYARKAAEAAECAGEQNKFWEYTDELNSNQSLITNDYLPQLAGELGLNLSKFNDCLSSGKYQTRVNDNYQEALAVGITGTPGVYVNDQLVKGAYPYETFQQIIDSILAK